MCVCVCVLHAGVCTVFECGFLHGHLRCSWVWLFAKGVVRVLCVYVCICVCACACGCVCVVCVYGHLHGSWVWVWAKRGVLVWMCVCVFFLCIPGHTRCSWVWIWAKEGVLVCGYGMQVCLVSVCVSARVHVRVWRARAYLHSPLTIKNTCTVPTTFG